MNAPAVSVNGLTVAFDGNSVLSDITFDVSEGAFVAIIGPNGAGKSTLLNTIIGIQPPTRGAVHLFGKPPMKTKADEIGYLPQLKTLDRTFPAIALELVVSGLSHTWPWRIRPQERATALQAMQRTGVGHLADRPVAALSGGELQRTYLARGLVRRPRLLILDEPAAGMDVIGEAETYHLLEEYCADTGATVLMVTHDWEGARAHASHILLIDRELVGFGPPAEIGDDARLLKLFGHKGHILATHEAAPDV